MRRSTKTSRRYFTCALAAVVFFATAVFAFGAVSAEVTVRITDGDVSSARKGALYAALAEAVLTIARRHVTADQLSQDRNIRKFISDNANSFISRYTIDSEGVEDDDSVEVESLPGETDPPQRFRLFINASIDRARLLSTLEKRGLEVLRLERSPRVLVGSGGDESSVRAATILVRRLGQEGIDATLYGGAVDPEVNIGELRFYGLEKADHLVAWVYAGPPPPELDEEGNPIVEADELAGEEVEEVPEGPAEVKVELVAEGGMMDVRDGQWFIRSEAKFIGRGPDEDSATSAGVEKVAERLFQSLYAQLVKSGWSMGRTLAFLEVEVEGMSGPAQLEIIETALGKVSEFSTVKLQSVSTARAVWRLEAVHSGFGWEKVLATIGVKGTDIHWTATGLNAPTTAETPIKVKGLWTPKSPQPLIR